MFTRNLISVNKTFNEIMFKFIALNKSNGLCVFFVKKLY